MNSKTLIVFTLVLMFSGSVFGADKWNVMLAKLRDLSVRKDKNTGVIIQKSITAQFQRQSGFNLILPKTNVTVDSFQDALNAGRAYKADIILYGDYYIEGEDLVVIVDVFDVLENRNKMRKYYSGEVTLDIFDTIDAMAADMVRKIREVLPELTEESQVRIRQIRQNIYEKEEVKIKRVFYTRLGFNTELGHKSLSSLGTMGWYNIPNEISGEWMKYSSIPIGFAFRFWEIRLDVMVSGLPGVPYVSWQHPEYSFEQEAPGSMGFVQLSYYLPWFNNSLALGVGYMGLGNFKHLGFDLSNKTAYFGYMNEGERGFEMAFGLIWNINPDWEVSFAVNPFMTNAKIEKRTDNLGNVNGTNHAYFFRDYPSFTLDTIYFLGNFGFEARASVDSYHLHEFSLDNFGATNWSEKNGDNYVHNVAVMLYLGFVYRVDFLNTGQ